MSDRPALPTVRRMIDAAVEAPIVTSFTNVGYGVRRRVDGWRPLDGYDLTGRVVVLTGATSGLGLAAAHRLAASGATLVLVGRRTERNERVAVEVSEVTGSTSISHVAADLGERDQVRELARRVLAEHDRLDVLIHNAGTLANERTENADGIEATVASQVVGPFLLTALLLDRLASSGASRVLTMSSGGMYASSLHVDDLEMPASAYDGTVQYARAKRAQVTLNELWAERYGDLGVAFHALHPGWADTPGVDESLPTFARVMGPLLRTPDQGADTLVWLAADDAALDSNGGFWLDRRRRSIHRLPTTRLSDTAERRRELWERVAAAAGAAPEERSPQPGRS